MKAWKKDAYYGGVAVYVGGKNRGCTQPNLGLYGFSSSSAKAIATAKDRTDLPGNLWYALWNGQETTTKD